VTALPHISRLSVQFGLAFALAMAGAGGLLYWLARAEITAEVEASLLREKARILPIGAPQDSAFTSLRLSALTGKRVISDKGHVILSPRGRILWGRITLSPPPDGFADVRFRDGRPDWREGRALTLRLADGARLVIIEHSEAVENLNAMLPTAIWALIALSSSVGLAAALVFSALIAKRLTRTMATADAIASGDLSRRIPMEGLDGVFAQQALGLNRIIDRMADMVHSQRQFASHLAHDLRTPLTRLRGLLQADQNDAPRPLLDRAERECRSIIAIFDALLRLSEIEAGRHPAAMAPLDLASIIEDVAETMEPVIADAGSTLHVGPLAQASIKADVGLLQQLLVNLLDNIALHTPASTQARITLQREGDCAVVILADNGPGIAAQERHRVIRPFERGQASAQSGSGLGLAIAQAIMRFHQGTLELADNQPGLTVRLRFPLAATPAHTF
jgi:signal transduction histidine kinase